MPPADPAGISGSSRPLPRALLLLAAVLLLARIATGLWEQRRPPAVAERVHWVEIERAAAEAERAHKPILYEFSADWCAPCKAMSREVFADRDAARRIELSFVPVRVLDRRQETGRNAPEVDSLQRAYSISAFPTLIVAWPGRRLFETTSGYPGREETMSWLGRTAAVGRLRGMDRADSTAMPH